MTELADHWEGIYERVPATEVGWYQREPATSLRLIETSGLAPSSAVIDVGAGASSLVDRLLARGFADVTLLDVSQRALEVVRARLGEQAAHVTFIHHDVLTWMPDRQYDVWHDRAVFHFFTERQSRERYVEIAARAIRLGGFLALATFAADGPTHCSGLPVFRCSVQDLEDAFAGSFAIVQHEREEHVTPGGVVQPFTCVLLRRI